MIWIFVLAQDSPRHVSSVFILILRENASSPIQLVGTGFAVDTPSKTIGMTAAHCIWFKNEQGVECRKRGDLFFVSNIERDEATGQIIIPQGTEEEPVLCYKMQPIYHNNRDICLLQIASDLMNSGPKFSDTIPICTTNSTPKSSKQEYRVKVYQAAITAFAAMNLPALDIEASEWCKACLIQKGRYFYAQTSAAPGSSGGPVINQMGFAVGIVVAGYIPELHADALPYDPDVDSASQWSGKVSGSGQIAGYTKITLIDGKDHPEYANILSRA